MACKRSCRLLQLVKEKDRSWIPRNSLIESVDRRSGRDKIKLSKKEYFKLFQNQNIKEEKKALKSGANTYMTAQRKIYMKLIRNLYQKFLNV